MKEAWEMCKLILSKFKNFGLVFALFILHLFRCLQYRLNKAEAAWELIYVLQVLYLIGNNEFCEIDAVP